MKRAGLAVISLILVLSGMMYFKGVHSQGMEVELGLINGELTPCPDKPNCVSTMAELEDEQHFIAPATFEVNPELALNTIRAIAAKRNFKVINEEGLYLHYSYQSKIMGFVDDIEFLIVGNKVHARSSSRVGHSDMGANRKRMIPILEEIKTLK